MHILTGLQNDHKAVMAEIEEGLHDVHATARAKKNLENSSQLASAGIITEVRLKLAFHFIIPLSLAENFDKEIIFLNFAPEKFGRFLEHSKCKYRK
jgi:hypothetical protein